jgi:hypothetical protein
MLDDILEKYPDNSFVKADGFDEAIIGVDIKSMRLVYSFSKCIDMLCETMSEEEAYEYFDFNILGSYIGEKTPIWVDTTLN